MHFDFTVTIGNIISIGAVLGAVWRIEIWLRKLDWMLMEHEILVREYCKRNDIKIQDLPTRLRYRNIRQSD